MINDADHPQRNLGARFASAHAISRSHRAAVDRGFTHRGMLSRAEIDEFCAGNGLTVETVVPISFFLPSGILYRAGLDREQRLKFEEEYNQWLERPEVYSFALWFEREIMAHMPLALSGSFMALLRKPAGSEQ